MRRPNVYQRSAPRARRDVEHESGADYLPAAHSTIAALPSLLAQAEKAAWKEDNRRLSNGDAFRRTAKLALASPVSRQSKGYWEWNEG